jgi:DNA-binding TFAR19-related protein (PDSD5 family)
MQDKKCCNALPEVGGAAMTVKRFRNQAKRCADLAKQTHDEESRQRLMRLELTYLQLAETEEQLAVQLSVLTSTSEPKRPETP